MQRQRNNIISLILLSQLLGEKYVSKLRLGIRFVLAILLRAQFEIRVVPAYHSAGEICSCRRDDYDPGRGILIRACCFEDGGEDERGEQEVTEMVRAKLSFKAFNGTLNGTVLRNGSVVDNDLDRKRQAKSSVSEHPEEIHNS